MFKRPRGIVLCSFVITAGLGIGCDEEDDSEGTRGGAQSASTQDAGTTRTTAGSNAAGSTAVGGSGATTSSGSAGRSTSGRAGAGGTGVVVTDPTGATGQDGA